MNETCKHEHLRARLSCIVKAEFEMGGDGSYSRVASREHETDMGTSDFECIDCGKALYYPGDFKEHPI